MLSAMATDGYTAALKLTAPIGDRVELYARAVSFGTDILGVSGDEDDVIDTME
ncbi:hypothetical protein SAMN02745781_00168 [Vibrio gazogenes DSM 21264]|uniref:Uncharacterized protein n=2 Tax=Vibrio gazogenes TaxID=687 RepID=A0A1M4SV06_VIBGA|nr:hypothetical protein [Vibrio gazogenes]USP15959.1 hypothetical protein MKS89_16340 [Vibrio gazogenes]SHE36018.1 hypothetical protein SAMN02745781_00168 [Vibrio gazogenes DSM 21264] [Vibrio gazogenes DSM 21264 = NBRC 103151]SJN54780.1 hypothetical protein BQ6471_01202 [Vibrio gazogenes]